MTARAQIAAIDDLCRFSVNIASANSPDASIHEIKIPAPAILRPADADLETLAAMIDAAENVAIFGGDGCRDAREEVLQLAATLHAPVGYTFRGKQWLEHDNPNAVGMTGLLGYGGAYNAIHDADLLLMLGTRSLFRGASRGDEFPLPGRESPKKVSSRSPSTCVRESPRHIGRTRDRQKKITRIFVGRADITGDDRRAAFRGRSARKTDRPAFIDKHSCGSQPHLFARTCCSIMSRKGAGASTPPSGPGVRPSAWRRSISNSRMITQAIFCGHDGGAMWLARQCGTCGSAPPVVLDPISSSGLRNVLNAGRAEGCVRARSIRVSGTLKPSRSVGDGGF